MYHYNELCAVETSKGRISKLENIKNSDVTSKCSVLYKISPRGRESFSPNAYSIHRILCARAKQSKFHVVLGNDIMLIL